MMEIGTILIWLLGAILWGIAAKVSKKQCSWAKFMFGFSSGVLFTATLAYVFLGGK